MEKILKTDLFKKNDKVSCNIRLVAPYSFTHRFKIDPSFVGRSLLEMVHAKFPFKTEKEWKQRIITGRVFVNENKVLPDFRLSATDEVFHYNPRVVEPSVPDEVEVLEEAEDYLIVFKPAPMPMHPGGRYFKNTLIKILIDQGFHDLKVTHRLDAVTSGIVLFARNKAFAKHVMNAFTSGLVEKEYLAKVVGSPLEKEKVISSKIRRKQGFVFESGSNLDNGVEGITGFKVLESSSDVSLIQCNPITGRTHQIRLHLAEWGHPIIDDPIYGIGGDNSSRRKQDQGISLMSTGLKIPSLNIDFRIVK